MCIYHRAWPPVEDSVLAVDAAAGWGVGGGAFLCELHHALVLFSKIIEVQKLRDRDCVKFKCTAESVSGIPLCRCAKTTPSSKGP